MSTAAVQAPAVTPPADSRFAARALRLSRLAHGHAAGEYLLFMAQLALAQAQVSVASRLEALPAPVDDALDACLPPFPMRSYPRTPLWRGDLRVMAEAVKHFAPVRLAKEIERMLALADDDLELAADRVLGDVLAPGQAVLNTFVGAALQVWFGRLASTLGQDECAGLLLTRLCPVCGSRPVASVLRLAPDGAAFDSDRVLHCALCESEWRFDRGRCAACGEAGGLRYWRHHVAGRPARTKEEVAPVRAESCERCHSYFKIFYCKADPEVDPIADDLASLALDRKMERQAYFRAGPAVLFQPGA